jgi:flagellar biosynthesis chaperone FliJ
MNLIETATEYQSRLDQATARIGEIAAELAETKDRLTALQAYQTAMEAKVTTVLQSGEAAQYEALAAEFLTPATEKLRLERLAKIEALKAETAALEAL